ncbi:MAG: hypothetical protein KDA63_14460, partial [Planctomycetales bacterium]|nr:hypothetical protein [Planctomycetales bacterium]
MHQHSCRTGRICRIGLFALAAMIVWHRSLTAQQDAKTLPPPEASGSYEEYPVPRDEVICFALYTVADNTLKLTAQLYPLKDDEDRTVRLEIKDGDAWREVARTEVIEEGWTAPLRVDDWDDSRTARYRVAHGDGARYEGTIRRNPIDKDVFVLAAFTGNSIAPAHGGDIPRTDIVENVRKIDADML